MGAMMMTERVPRLRFSGFEGSWRCASIQELLARKVIVSHLDGNHGALYPKREEFVKEGVPYVTANDFINGLVNLERCKYLPISRASQFKKGIAKDGDVLFAHNATVGPVAILKTKLNYVILSTTATYFRCDSHQLSNLYVLFYFQTDFFIRQYTRVMSQTTRNQVPITAQRLFSLFLPSLPEQKKIADFLTTIDEKITQLTQKKDGLTQYKKGMMQKLFSQEIRFRDEDGGEFPGWVERRLGEVFIFHNTNSFSRALMDKNNGSVKNIHYGDIHTKFKTGFILENEEVPHINRDVDIRHIKEDQYCKVGDLVIADASEDYKDIGKTIEIISVDNQKVLGGLHTYIARPNKDEIALGFPGYQMQTFDVRLQVMIFATGVSVLGISKNNLSKIKINLPSLPEQKKIADFLTAIDQKLEHVNKKIEQVKSFKKGLLQQMFV